MAQEIQPGPYLPADTSRFVDRLVQIEESAYLPTELEYAKVYRESYAERSRSLRAQMNSEQLIFNPQVTDYLSGLLGEVAMANGIDDSFLVLVSRTPVINAASLGDNIFVVYIGLLFALTSEDELAFVLAHELAHDQLAHTRQSIQSRAVLEVEKPNERLSKRARRHKLNKDYQEEYMTAVRKAIYLQRRHSRRHELQADSLALQYLRNTEYATGVAARALNQLEINDLLEFPVSAITQSLNIATYPFKESWLAAKRSSLFGGSFGGGAKADSVTNEEPSFWKKDSLKTHPEMEARRERLLPLLQTTNDSLTGKPIHSGLRNWVITEAMANFQRSELPVQTLCVALKYVSENGDTPLTRLAIAESLFMVSRSIEEYTFDELVPPPNYFEHSGGQNLTRMLRKMSPSELRELTFAYSADALSQYPENTALNQLSRTIKSYFKQ